MQIKEYQALSRAEEIAGEGHYEDIIEKLRADGELFPYVEKMRDAYGSRLSLDHFVMTDHDFEMLTVLGLYDMHTLEHSVRTFELAYQIVTRTFTESGKTVIMGDYLGESGVSLPQFLRAALFHDIGKIIIPREVLRNALDDEEVLVKMFPEENLEREESQTKKKILQTLYAKGIRPIDVVPLKEIFSGGKYTELLCGLEKRGFSETATLKDVIRMHEPEGKRILNSLGYATEGELAGGHHNYEAEEHSHIMDTPYGTFAVANLLRIADVTDALRSARWYKNPLSELEVLFVLVKDAEAGKINPELARLWVGYQFRELCAGRDASLVPDGDFKEEKIRDIENFLAVESPLGALNEIHNSVQA